jgi:hypothetical protein
MKISICSARPSRFEYLRRLLGELSLTASAANIQTHRGDINPIFRTISHNWGRICVHMWVNFCSFWGLVTLIADRKLCSHFSRRWTHEPYQRSSSIIDLCPFLSALIISSSGTPFTSFCSAGDSSPHRRAETLFVDYIKFSGFA